jgi:periplasmic divalent cation tolerance protein
MTANSSQALVVLTTCANAEEARSLAEALVTEQLAACVSALGGITSTYRWQGQLKRDQESLLIIKTTEARFAAVEQLIHERSSYELPEVLAVGVVTGSADYLSWLEAAVEDRMPPVRQSKARTEG